MSTIVLVQRESDNLRPIYAEATHHRFINSLEIAIEKTVKQLRIEQTLEIDGKITVTGLPYKKGQALEIIFSPRLAKKTPGIDGWPVPQIGVNRRVERS